MANWANRFVDPVNGIDAGDGTRGAPWRTIAYANATVTGGGVTIWLRGGVYNEGDIAITSTTSLSTYNRGRWWSAYEDEEVIIKPTSATNIFTGVGTTLNILGASINAYNVFTRIIFDGTGCSGPLIATSTLDVTKKKAAPHHWQFRECEFRNSASDGVFANYGRHFWFRRCTFHDIVGNALNFQGSNHIVDECEFTAPITGAAIRLNAPDTRRFTDYCWLRRNKIHGLSGNAMLISGGGENLPTVNDFSIRCHNNVIWDCGGVGITIGGTGINPRFAYVDNNTIYRCTGRGIDVLSSSISARVRNNIAYLNTGGNIVNNGSSTLQQANITTNPHFDDPTAADEWWFRVAALSPAAKAGVDAWPVIDDIRGEARRKGLYDCGAWQRERL